MHRNLSLASATLVLLAALMPLTSCERTRQSAPAKMVTVAIRDFKYDPEIVTVHEGDTVEWKNADNVPHTATAAGQAQKPAFDSGSISTGAAWHYVAGTKGTYNYTCTFHPNMKGELIVQ
jgi:plastocyanin